MNEGLVWLMFWIFVAGVGAAFYFFIKFLMDDANKPKQSKSSFVNRINSSSYKRIFSK